MSTFAKIPNSKLIRGAGVCNFSSVLGALEHAYTKHYDIAISPDHVWFTLLCEIAAFVKEAPDHWAHLFTTKPGEKQELVIPADDPELINMGWLTDALKEVVPSNIVPFFPSFSTTDAAARTACQVAFADVASPYYNYSTYLCRIPEVYVLGADEDWQALHDTIKAVIGDVFGEHYWCDRIRSALFDMYLGAPIFNLKKCGSGHDEEVSGEWVKLFRNAPSVRYIQNYPTGIAQIRYQELASKRRFLLQAGVFEEHVDTTEEVPVLTPHFGYRLHELFEEAK